MAERVRFPITNASSASKRVRILQACILGYASTQRCRQELTCETNEPSKLLVLPFETDLTRAPMGDLYKAQLGVHGHVLGEGKDFKGWSGKWYAVLDYIRTLNPEDLVIVTDYRDVLVNGPSLTNEHLRQAECTFQKLIGNATDAILVSAEAQCCVSALHIIAPGHLVGQDGERNKVACASGDELCKEKKKRHADHQKQWVKKMRETANARGIDNDCPNIYLNAGLVAARVRAFESFLRKLQLKYAEDDQAVFTDALFSMPDRIVLDYGQELFGNAPHYNAYAHMPIARIPPGGCAFKWHPNRQKYLDTVSTTCPIFLHTPGGKTMNDYECLRKLGSKLEKIRSREEESISSEPTEQRAPTELFYP